MIRFTAPLWRWSGGNWFFVTLPAETASEVRLDAMGQRGGFGSIKVSVRVGETSWRTSLFPDKSSGSFLLPMKKSVRQAEGLSLDLPVDIELEVAG
ncbi:DUF1905 domain-containing protein [Sphingomicrobium sediminis]|uniref:DUF1905 domain-containing protein n=1 Tax=Sphingomicrobium sediminis TaxID=2950949 RepID=A0A9X2EHJ3_9SPHN|nr:DUF1905 domain-containing protein [Sphingomicrobium sediminis]